MVAQMKLEKWIARFLRGWHRKRALRAVAEAHNEPDAYLRSRLMEHVRKQHAKARKWESAD
jgi:hypothetical protein